MNAVTPQDPVTSLPVIQKIAQAYDLSVQHFVFTFREVAMPKPHTDAELVSCCLVAQQHGMNPLTKEIFFMKTKGGSIQPIVSVDGWAKKCNEHPQFDGMDFEDVHDAQGKLISTTCVIHRKDRMHPVKVTEYLDECERGGGPVWRTHPRRMLRHRALTQCARYAFGFAGVMDLDEFRQWQDSERSVPPRGPAAVGIPEIDGPALDQHVDDIPVIDISADVAAAEAAVMDKPEPDVVASILGEIECTTWSSLAELLDANDEALAAMSAAGKTRIEEAILGKMIKTWSAAKGIRAKESVAEGFDSLLDKLSDPIRRTAEAVFEGRKVAS